MAEDAPQARPTAPPQPNRPGLWLVLLTALAFSPALAGDFLNWDDPWLVGDNPYLDADTHGAVETLTQIWTGLDRQTRYTFGAEYLPVRDTSWWVQTRLFGKSATGLHIVQWALYLLAVWLMRLALVRTLGGERWVEWLALAFALHPVHVESVGWIAGHKDVLALVFVSGALAVHAGEHRHRWLFVGVLVACASLSKSMSIAVVPLMVVQDLWRRRPPQWRTYVAGGVAVVATMAMHLHVGEVMGMVAEPVGGSRLSAAMTMGPVWLRYLGLSLYPAGLSIVQDVPVLTSWTVWSVAGYLLLLVWFGAGAARARHGKPLVLAACLWFVVPLVPVSQVFVPLQNKMADRYLWLSVVGPLAMLAGPGSSLLPSRERLVQLLGALFLVGLFGVTAFRSYVFTDSLLVFADARDKTTLDDEPVYQLGMALQSADRWPEAAVAFREAAERAPAGSEHRRKALNNLARALFRIGQAREAADVLRGALDEFPASERVRGNLIQVLRALGRDGEAEAVRAAGGR